MKTYRRDYVEINNALVPLRWMAWESIVEVFISVFKIFSCKTLFAHCTYICLVYLQNFIFSGSVHNKIWRVGLWRDFVGDPQLCRRQTTCWVDRDRGISVCICICICLFDRDKGISVCICICLWPISSVLLNASVAKFDYFWLISMHE